MEKLDIFQLPPHNRSFNSVPTNSFHSYSSDLRNKSDNPRSTTSIPAPDTKLAIIDNTAYK